MKKTILLLALFSVIVGLTSCQKAEEITVSKYFQAMQHDDKDTMAAMAVEPKALKFKKFEIAMVEEPVIKELELNAFQEKLKELEAKKKDQLGIALDKNDEVEELRDEKLETRRRSKKAELDKKIEEAEALAKAEKDKFLELSKEVDRIKKRIELEKQMITTSTGIEQGLESMNGETHETKVVVKVTQVNDEVKEYIFLLRKNVIQVQDRTINGRQVIVKITTEQEMAEEAKKAEEAKAAEQQEEVTETEPAAEEGTEEGK
jgi:hypothetical protein